MTGSKTLYTKLISLIIFLSFCMYGFGYNPVFSQGDTEIIADFDTELRAIREPVLGINMFAYDHATLSHPEYQENILYMNPGSIRVHNSNMMLNSNESPFGWLTPSGWDENRIKLFASDIKVLQDRGLTSNIIINVPGFPSFADGQTNPAAYGAWMGQLANILWDENSADFAGIEITNELEDNLDTANILVPAYIAAAQAIKQINPSIKTGGLSFEQVQEQDYQAFIDGVHAINPSLLDFVSYHQYGGGNMSTQSDNLLNSRAQWITLVIANNIRTYLNNKGMNNTRVYHNEFNVCWSFHCGDPNVLEILNITNSQDRADAFGVCINSGVCGDERMRNQFSTVFDATVLRYHLESSGDGIAVWNDKDFFYGKLDQNNQLRLSSFLFTMIARREPDIVYNHTNSENGILNSIKSSTWKDSANNPHILLINPSISTQTIMVQTHMFAQHELREITEAGYRLKTEYFETGNMNHEVLVPSFSVILISPQGSQVQSSGISSISGTVL